MKRPHPSSNSLSTAPARTRFDLPDRAAWLFRVTFTLASVLLLAFSAKDTLRPRIGAGDRGSSRFMIEAIGRNRGSSGPVPHELWLTALIRDGQLLRAGSIDHTRSWELVDRSELPPHLVNRTALGPARLSWQGRDFVAVFESSQWSGVLRVERDGREVQSMILPTTAEHEGRFVVESPGAPPLMSVFLGSLIVFGGCAWWFGPIRAGRSGVPWLMFVLAVLHLLVWVSQCVGTTNDSSYYLTGFFQVLYEGRPAYFPPGYGALLGLLQSVSGECLGRVIALTQHAMVLAGALWIYLLLRRIVTEGLALLGGFLAGALPPCLTFPQTVMSEASTLLAMVGALYFAMQSSKARSAAFAVVAGVLTGWAGTLRVIPLAALLPSVGLLQLLTPARGGARRFAVTITSTAIVVLLPVSWCWYKSGQPMLADSWGLHLYNRVVVEQKQLDEGGRATRILLARLEGKDPTGLTWWEVLGHRGFDELSDRERELLLRQVSLEGIRKDPWRYLAYTPQLAWKELMADPSYWIANWGETVATDERLENPPPLAFTASSLTWRWSLEKIHRLLWPALCWLAVAGTILGLLLPQRILIVALALVPTSYLLLSALVECFAARYNSAIVPFVVALSMVPLGLVPAVFGFGLVGRKERSAL